MILYDASQHIRLITRVTEFAGDRVLSKEEKSHFHQFAVKGEDAYSLLEFLKSDPDLAFQYFIDLSAVDYLEYAVAQPERFAVVYTLLSPKLGIKTQVKAFVSDALPRIASITGLFAGANWTEREVWDLYGIEFTGHPDLKRILMPDDYEGHPLRKDYPLRGRGERSAFPVYRSRPQEG